MIITPLLPGERLAEHELAAQLGISRQPVREALQRLQSEGWVGLRPGHGAYVHMPTQREADQLLAVRTLLEAESSRLAAGVATEEHVQQLWALWQAGLDALASRNTDALVAANAALHAWVMSISLNAVLAELSGLVERRVRWYHAPPAQTRDQQS